MPTAPPNARRKQALLARTAVNRVSDQRRGSSRDRGYTTQWDAAAKAWLREHPLCQFCATSREARITPATLVDHYWPHKGDQELFWDQRWWVSSCTPCHNGFKQRLEHAGVEAMHRVAARLGLEPRIF